MNSSEEILFTFGNQTISPNKDYTGIRIDDGEEQLLLSFLYDLKNHLDVDPDLENNIRNKKYYDKYIIDNSINIIKPLAVIEQYEISKHPLLDHMYIRNRFLGRINGRGQVAINVDLVYEIVSRYSNGTIPKPE